jgi:hypothetical protein
MKNLIRATLLLAVTSSMFHSANAGAATLKQAIADAIANRVPAPGRYEVVLATPDTTLDQTSAGSSA